MKYLGNNIDTKDLVNKKYVDDNTVTYSFEDGVDGFTVTSSDGTTQTVDVGGTMGVSNSGGLFYPNSLEPMNVGKGSLLVTEGHKTSLGNKSLSVTTGFNLSVSSVAAPSKVFTVANNYGNRILCTIALGGVACLNESDSANTVTITSIKVGTSDVAPSSTDSSTPITVTLSQAIGNSGTTISTIRIYPKQEGFSNLLTGVARAAGGYSVAVGQQVGNNSNASAVFGNTQYNTGNSSILAGRQHINNKQNAALFGMGHDTTNASTEVTAVGKYSNLSSGMLFAIGNGTSNTNRSNALYATSTGTTINGDLTIGSTTITENQLKQLLTLIN